MTGRGLRIANAPVSYGAFEVTVGVMPNVPAGAEVLAAIAAAGYEGTELGPPGYFGAGDELRAQLERHGLALAGAYIPFRFSEPDHWDEDLAAIGRTLDLLEAGGTPDARPVLADAGSAERAAHPGRAAHDRSVALDDRGWRRLLDGVARAAEQVRERGYDPTFHHHTATFVEAPWEIERLLEGSDVGLLLDTGHLALGGGDPAAGLRDWTGRIDHVHLKDVRQDVIDSVVAEGAGMMEAWRRGVFCELGAGDIDVDAFVAQLLAQDYAGWLVIEQDRILAPDESAATAVEAQERNLAWLGRALAAGAVR